MVASRFPYLLGAFPVSSLSQCPAVIFGPVISACTAQGFPSLQFVPESMGTAMFHQYHTCLSIVCGNLSLNCQTLCSRQIRLRLMAVLYLLVNNPYPGPLSPGVCLISFALWSHIVDSIYILSHPTMLVEIKALDFYLTRVH